MQIGMRDMRTCAACGASFLPNPYRGGRPQKYCDLKCKGVASSRAYRVRCPEKSRESVKASYHRKDPAQRREERARRARLLKEKQERREKLAELFASGVARL